MVLNELYRLGCFPVDQGRPTLTSLRYAIDLLAAGQQVVVFPEGRINRTDEPIRLRQGLAEIKLRKDEWERNDYFPINASQYQDSAVKFHF